MEASGSSVPLLFRVCRLKGNRRWLTACKEGAALLQLQTGLSLMVEDGTVFGCYKSMWDVIFYSELGSSWSILAAGYSIDALMLRYQGVDWTNLSTWDCNARLAAPSAPSHKNELLCHLPLRTCVFVSRTRLVYSLTQAS